MAVSRLGDRDGMRDQDCNAITLQEKDLSEKIARTRVELEHRKRRIWLFGHFGLGNFGNESTLQAMLYHLRRLLPDVQISCICTGPAATGATHNIRALPISRAIVKAWMPHNRVAKLLRSAFIGMPCELYRWFDGLMTLNGTDVLIVPGTGLISDAYSLRGWGPYSMFKWSLIAKLRGCKLLFVSVGAGPIYGRLGRFLVKSALALADFRSYRDISSLQYLKSIGFVTTHDRVYPDLAFSLPKDLLKHDSDKNRNGQRNRRRPIVGLGVMLYAGRYSVEKPNAMTFRNYLDNLAILVNWLLTREYDVRLLMGDLCDRPVMEEFKSLLKERLPVYDASRILDDEVVSVEQLLSQLAETELVVATRFHNVLLALLNDKPVIAISFHHKVASLMSAMGLSEYCLDINRFRAEELISKVCDVEHNVGTLTPLIRERAENCRAALEEQYECICREVCQ
jgi:polysaccharide pyruvyl transferase WcaK-like protein